MITTALLSGSSALVVSALAQVGLVRWLPSWGLLDLPSARSSHVTPTPRGGGLGVTAGVAVGVAISVGLFGEDVGTEGVAAAGLVAFLALTGLVDDVRGLSAALRFALMLGAGAVLALAYDATPLEVALVGVWVTACTNAVNFMDGINGITGLTGGVVGSWYASVGAVQADTLVAALGAAAAGASLGFLPFNSPRARVFLGDSGSYLLGAIFAVCAYALYREGVPLVIAVAPLVPYLADTGATLVRRAARRERLFSAHRGHVYQQLSRARFSHAQVALAVAAFAVLCCVVALMLPWNWAAVVLAALAATYLASPRLLCGGAASRTEQAR